ncbi:hypothetical protein FEM48_Zijuj03G0019000 [Ziziphus jujuba var. spinosa]|uniref:Disease resistance protein At4g27190-like leucine-rich repeats domain-containing protein n=1 Tax=Ziziphus jujuba var. spinosa TaxID=714518 RepID=A0A978VMG8_ZIZJJ|nr:hypothetical protein FEM48_Zijuj03G0019000 [Ziziphus jujuba var. spinosa]
MHAELVFLPVLDELEVSECHDLTRIWDDQILPSSASFHNLTKLLIVFCNSLEYLFSSAMATSFVQLKSLVIRHCRGMKEIVRNSENIVKMSFPKLNLLYILDLESLTTFSSEIDIDFPVLTKLCMEGCPEFSTFISKSGDEKLPSLFNEKVVKVAFPSLKNLEIGAMNKLKMIANNADVFHKLKELRIYHCDNVMKIFGSRTQRALASLRRLDIYRCAKVEEVFEIQASSFEEITHDRISAQLIHLSLHDLPNLRYVWGKDPQGNITFTHLEQVEVWSCPSLKSIFPFSIAKGLYKLRELNLISCGIEQIVEDVGTTVSVPPEFVFPRLEDIVLNHLKNLVCIYPGFHTSSWPSLTTLVVEKCEQVKVLALEFSCFQDKPVHHDHDNSQIPQVPLFFTKDCSKFKSFVSKLEGKDCTTMTSLFHDKFASFPKLKELKSYGWVFTKIWDDQFQLSSTSFLLNQLYINGCPAFETFISNGEQNLYTGTMPSLFNEKVAFPSLYGVVIESMDKLRMIWQYDDEFSTASSFCKLKYVTVGNCENLMKIIPSNPQATLTFPNLKKVEASKCPSLESFFPPSIAKGLFQLQGLFTYLKLATIRKFTYDSLYEVLFNLQLFKFHFQKIWDDPLVLGSTCFRHLTILEVDGLLNELSIQDCPQFGTFVSKSEQNSCTAIPSLFNQKLTELSIEGCSKFVTSISISEDNLCTTVSSFFNKTSATFSTIASSLEGLHGLNIRDCKMAEIISNNEMMKKVSFPDLEYLELENLPNLASFSSAIFLEFPVLKRLSINDCPELKGFISMQEEKFSIPMPPLFNEKGYCA